MSSFSADWLRLREVADHRARDAGLLDTLAAWAAPRDCLTIVDLGCGTGSNARAMIPRLPGKQHWRLVDHSRTLLEAAREALAPENGNQFRAMTVQIQKADIAPGIAPLIAGDCDLVTAAALFDLVSKAWLDGMVAALAARALPLYTVLIYDGVMDWEPAHPADVAVRDAFNAHQQSDKGFGSAVGPDAGPYLIARLKDAGFGVTTAPSPWRLGDADQTLLLANLEGVARAVRQTGRIAPAELTDWLTFRSKGGRCSVGHLDVLALPRVEGDALP